jgi:hypothetical protein
LSWDGSPAAVRFGAIDMILKPRDVDRALTDAEIATYPPR